MKVYVVIEFRKNYKGESIPDKLVGVYTTFEKASNVTKNFCTIIEKELDK